MNTKDPGYLVVGQSVIVVINTLTLINELLLVFYLYFYISKNPLVLFECQFILIQRDQNFLNLVVDFFVWLLEEINRIGACGDRNWRCYRVFVVVDVVDITNYHT